MLDDNIEMLKMYSAEALVKELRSREEIAQVSVVLNHQHKDLIGREGRTVCDECYSGHCRTLSPPCPPSYLKNAWRTN